MTKVDEAADFLLSFDPEIIDSPYLPNINLKQMQDDKVIVPLQLTPTMSDDEARAYEGEPLKDFKYTKLPVSTVGLKGNKVIFLYLTRMDFHLISDAEIALATEGLSELKWDQADNSNRKCLRGTHGRELHFGWCDGFGKIRVYVPTVDQTLSWMKL